AGAFGAAVALGAERGLAVAAAAAGFFLAGEAAIGFGLEPLPAVAASGWGGAGRSGAFADLRAPLAEEAEGAGSALLPAFARPLAGAGLSVALDAAALAGALPEGAGVGSAASSASRIIGNGRRPSARNSPWNAARSNAAPRFERTSSTSSAIISPPSARAAPSNGQMVWRRATRSAATGSRPMRSQISAVASSR